MHDGILFGAPLLIGAIVLAVRFVGCSFQAGAAETNYSGVVDGTPGIVSFWRLNEQTGTEANDSVDGNAGTYNGGVTLGIGSQVHADVANFAAEFDGSSGFVDVPFAANVNPAQFTVEAIVNPSAIGDGSGADLHSVVVSRSGDASNNTFGYILYLHGSGFQARAGTGTTTITVLDVPAGAVANGGPYYVAMTYDGTTLSLFVNPTDAFDPGNPGETAQQQASVATAYVPNTTSDLTIGASNFPGPGERLFFPGVINDVAVYDVALDFSTIQAHYMVMMTGFSM
jgi:hypothetical protein